MELIENITFKEALKHWHLCFNRCYPLNNYYTHTRARTHAHSIV